MLSIQNEFDPLQHVIVGTGIGMKPEADPTLQQGLPETSALYTQPDPEATEQEFEGVCSALKRHGMLVQRPSIVDSLEVVDQTCPRDIGFVIDGLYFQANSASILYSQRSMPGITSGYPKMFFWRAVT